MHARFDADRSKLIVFVFNKREKVGDWNVRAANAVGATGFRVTRLVHPNKDTQRIGWVELNSDKPEP